MKKELTYQKKSEKLSKEAKDDLREIIRKYGRLPIHHREHNGRTTEEFFEINKRNQVVRFYRTTISDNSSEWQMRIYADHNFYKTVDQLKQEYPL